MRPNCGEIKAAELASDINGLAAYLRQIVAPADFIKKSLGAAFFISILGVAVVLRGFGPRRSVPTGRMRDRAITPGDGSIPSRPTRPAMPASRASTKIRSLGAATDPRTIKSPTTLCYWSFRPMAQTSTQRSANPAGQPDLKARREAWTTQLRDLRKLRAETKPSEDRDKLKAQVRDLLHNLRVNRPDKGRDPVPLEEEQMAETIAELKEERKWLPEAERKALTDRIDSMNKQLGMLAAIRVAQPRLDTVTNAIALLGNLAGGNYNMPDDAVAFLFSSLHRQLDDTQALFSATKPQANRISLAAFKRDC